MFESKIINLIEIETNSKYVGEKFITMIVNNEMLH